MPTTQLEEILLPLTTRALHIEVAQSLDTKSSLSAVTGFTARRGYPDTINSDNRTNIVRTTNKLKAAMNDWEKAKIESDLAQKKIVWKFNPPGAPHFHRMKEKLVQRCKKARFAILDIKSLITDVLSTAMCLRANFKSKTPDSSNWRNWKPEPELITHAKSFPVRERKREGSIHGIQWVL